MRFFTTSGEIGEGDASVPERVPGGGHRGRQQQGDHRQRGLHGCALIAPPRGLGAPGGASM